jgi:hypothetical protein
MGFQVVPVGIPAFPEEWQRAMNVPASELPQLNEKQLAEVKRFSFDPETYTRLKVLIRQYAKERESEQGARFGKIIESILEPLRGEYTVSEITRRGAPNGWNVIVRHEQKGTFEFQCLFETVDALVKGRVSPQDKETFRANVLQELGEDAAYEAVK